MGVNGTSSGHRPSRATSLDSCGPPSPFDLSPYFRAPVFRCHNQGDHTITISPYPHHVTARLDATDMSTIREIHRVIRPGKVTSFTDVLRFLLSEWRKAERRDRSASQEPTA